MTILCSIYNVIVLRIFCYVKGILFHGLHFSSYLSLDYMCIQMLIWEGDPTDRHSICFYFYLVIFSSIGIVTNSLLLLTPELKLSTMHVLISLPIYSRYIGSYKTWVPLKYLALLCYVRINWFRLLIIMFPTIA